MLADAGLLRAKKTMPASRFSSVVALHIHAETGNNYLYVRRKP